MPEPAAADGPNVRMGLINISASELDTFLKRKVTFEVARCPNSDGEAVSTFTAELTSDIPAGLDLPEYVISQAEVCRDGPIDSTLVQFHLSNGAQVKDVTLDGESVPFSQFTEQGRPSLVLKVDLAPRQTAKVVVSFVEPTARAAGKAPEQAMATTAVTTITDQPCS